jgi:mRNA interferase RelE/StbE
MKVMIDKSFEKDTDKISDKILLNRIADKIESVKQVHKLSEITHCKKMKNSKTAYRIKIGDYRAGFEFENNTVIFIRFLHRSKIYDYFPE